MKKFSVFIAESLFPEDIRKGNQEGEVVQAISRVLHWKSRHKDLRDKSRLCKAIRAASEDNYDIIHLSCHGDADGIQLADETELSWDELADCFQGLGSIPAVLVLSSCVGGDHGIARAFKKKKSRPQVIFGAEGRRKKVITFPGACISWPILYTSLAKSGITREAFKDAMKKMNLITHHRFVYRRWSEDNYVRYPAKP
jgi:CHAT domain